MRISDWISDVCSSDLVVALFGECAQASLQPAVIAGQDDDQQQLGMQPTGLRVNFWCRHQRCNTEQPGADHASRGHRVEAALHQAEALTLARVAGLDVLEEQARQLEQADDPGRDEIQANGRATSRERGCNYVYHSMMTK